MAGTGRSDEERQTGASAAVADQAADRHSGAPRAVAFFDVDGTLIYHDMEADKNLTPEERANVRTAEPSPAVFDAFRRMRANGHATFICTGRPAFFVQDGLMRLNPTGVVAEAGAYVSINGQVVHHQGVPHELLLKTMRLFEEHGLNATVESSDLTVELHPTGDPAFFDTSVLVRTPDALEPYLENHVFSKFCTHGTPREDLAPALPFCTEHYTISDLQGGVLEFSLKGVDKAAGIATALAALGHGRAGTYAFGDSENDLPMARAVETFVAMGNALPVVKERAAYVTDDVRHDGVVTALEHFGLI